MNSIKNEGELVDVVDKNRKVISQKLKTLCHQDGDLHCTVIGLLRNSKGKFTLVKQSETRQDAGMFVSPIGGHIRSGESDIEALKREAKEETGLQDFKYRFVGQAIYYREIINRKENHYFIMYEVYTDKPPILNHEAVGFRTFSPDKLKRELKSFPDQFGAAFHFVVDNFYPELKK